MVHRRVEFNKGSNLTTRLLPVFLSRQFLHTSPFHEKISQNLFRSHNNSHIQFLHRRKTARMIAGLFDYMQKL